MSSVAAVKDTVRDVEFFEKPRCINNTKQKRVLAEFGYGVIEKDLLTEPWTVETLRVFFGDRPVADWFNRGAPQVKSGEVIPERISEDDALSAMIANPLLIRRPLMRTDLGVACGWEPGSDRMRALGIDLPNPDEDIVTCPRTHETNPGSCS